MAAPRREGKDGPIAMASRRELLGIAGGALLVRPGAGRAVMTANALAADLEHYIGFGVKSAGGPGDMACGTWLESALNKGGFATSRQQFTVPFLDTQAATLAVGDQTFAVLAQPFVQTTGPDGVTAPLVAVDEHGADNPALHNAIALIDLPYRRWSSLYDGQIIEAASRAFAAGARAVLLATNGPTGQAIALNVNGDRPIFDRPVAVLAPAAATKARAIEAANATLTVSAATGRRPAFNLAGKIDRGAPRWLVVSTPRSGWTIAAGERGGGIATWLALARWAPKALPAINLAFLCNSGHEYENLGAAHALAGAAPDKKRTAFWLHLGANVAARDWHDIGGGQLLPLPTADPQRFLLTSPALVEGARQDFSSISGLEMAYPIAPDVDGELGEILRAGYEPVAGILGAHRFHHVRDDDERCIDAPMVAPVVTACQKLIARALG